MTPSSAIPIAILGGSGLNELAGLTEVEERTI